AATKIAARLGMFPRKDVIRLIALLQMAGLPVKFKDLSLNDLLQTMSLDKKNVSSEHIRFILPKRIGHVIMVEDLSHQVITDVLKEQKE
ncbi:MAG: 3-dehydroquinate synthase, partial [bacterium]